MPELLRTVDPEEVEIAVIGSKPIELAAMPNLKAIFKCGVGTDNIPFKEAISRDIEIWMPSEETKDFIFEETANFAVIWFFECYLMKSVKFMDGQSNRGFLGNKKVLVLGNGNIGAHVTRKLKPFVDVLTFDILENSMNELLIYWQADVTTLHIPLLESTKNFIDEEKLSFIKDGGALVNTARGAIVDEHALYNEIKSGRLRAAFDVFWTEPYEGKLKQFHPNKFLMSPCIK